MNLLSALPITSNANIFIDLGIALVLVAFISYCCFRFKLSTKVIITTYTALTLLILASIFDLPLIRTVTVVGYLLFTIYASLLLTSQEKETEIRANKKVSKKENALTVNETDELVENLQKAIEALSSTQTGALITLEKTDDLLAITKKSGTVINASVTPELLGTIFYKGTPLHDGHRG